MAGSNIIVPPGQLSGVEANTKDEIRNVRHFNVINEQLYGQNKPAGPSSLELEVFKGNRCPLSGVDLGTIGAEYDMQFAVNPNPKQGFTIKLLDSKESADELTQYQVMKGGYDGKFRLLIEYHRAYAPALNDPFVTITMFQKEIAIDKITGNVPLNIKQGTLMEWRENAWREEAKKILRSINGYNPSTQEVCRVSRKYVPSELTPEEANFTLRHDDQHIFREEEIVEVITTPVNTLPKIRYLENFFRCLDETRKALGYN